MDEVEVKVVELQIRKRFFESFERCLVTAASIPDLAWLRKCLPAQFRIASPRPTLLSLLVDRGDASLALAG